MYANINAKVSRLASQVGQVSIQKGGGSDPPRLS